MKLWPLIFSIFYLANVFAIESEDCDENGSPKLNAQAREAELTQIAKQSGDKILKTFIEPTKQTCSTVTYEFAETDMKPGDSVYFHVPLEQRKRGVRFMVIGHRQDPSTNKGGKWDDKPGLSSVQIYSKNTWNYWKGSASGKKGAKFAEVRHRPELENLYDWDHYGYANAKTDEVSHNELLPEAIKVESVGEDKVRLSGITLKLAPPEEKNRDEKIFTPGTSFTSPDGKEKYKLGGGQRFGGKFPKAKVLNEKTLSLPLKSGKKISSIEIAAGDSHPDGIQNSDGGVGTQGWGKISVGIKKKNGSITWLLQDENVPPEGIIIASPAKCDDVTESDSEVIINGSSDNVYIMGVKVGYQN